MTDFTTGILLPERCWRKNSVICSVKFHTLQGCFPARTEVVWFWERSAKVVLIHISGLVFEACESVDSPAFSWFNEAIDAGTCGAQRCAENCDQIFRNEVFKWDLR